MAHLALCCATVCLVFGRAIQQQNVIHGHYLAAAVTPYMIAAGEVAVIGIVSADPGLAAVISTGTGGAIGATAAMAVHRRIRQRATR